MTKWALGWEFNPGRNDGKVEFLAYLIHAGKSIENCTIYKER